MDTGPRQWPVTRASARTARDDIGRLAASVQALAFVAERLTAESVGVIFAARTGEVHRRPRRPARSVPADQAPTSQPEPAAPRIAFTLTANRYGSYFVRF